VHKVDIDNMIRPDGCLLEISNVQAFIMASVIEGASQVTFQGNPPLPLVETIEHDSLA